MASTASYFSNRVVDSNWGTGKPSIQFTASIAGATPQMRVTISPLPPNGNEDEMEMDGIIGSGYVSAPNIVTVYLVAYPGPIAGIRPINILLGV